MSNPTVPLREFSDVFAAEAVRSRLDAAGIRAFVTGTDQATALGLGGAMTTRGVRLEVPPADYDRAREILVRDDQVRREASSWLCSRCEEPNEATFEICWSCSKPRSDEDAEVPLADPFEGQLDAPERLSDAIECEAAPADRPPEDGNPYRPVLIDQRSPSRTAQNRDGRTGDGRTGDGRTLTTNEMDEQVRSLLRASMAACLLFPPILTLYVIPKLLAISPQVTAEATRRSRLRWCWIINVIALVIGTIWWMVFMTGI